VIPGGDRLGGETGAGPGFTGAADAVRVVLAFPETYEIGISNQAIQILYHLARRTPGVEVERTYLPAAEVIDVLRAEGIPLLTSESWTPVSRAQLLGISVAHELTYTNVLELLDLAGLPLRTPDRGEEVPLVVAGGPAAANFLPLAPFLDAVVVGDGEEVFPQILARLKRAMQAGRPRAERRAALAEIEGVFVPGLSTTVRRQAVARLEPTDYPDACLVSLTAGVHDRAWIEVMRGCCRGCRYCQAGMWYRPVRERRPEEVLRMAGAQLGASGHEDLALASLSSTDYTALGPVLAGLAERHPEVHVNLPSLRVDSAAVRLGHLTSPTSPSLTLAPEAGSQRLRDVINKNVSEADILSAAREAFSLGHTTLKLYFMIGLPTETDDDVQALVDLVLRLQSLGRDLLGPRRGRLQLNVSVTNCVPKPFTPFQWAAMPPRDVLERRHDLLRRGLRRRGIKLALHDIDGSYLEAALARGGEEAGTVIEGAWRRGARFDAWSEHERPAAWAEAYAEAGTSPATLATQVLARDAPLPWDLIEGVVDKDFLWREWQQALAAEPTDDCRWAGCSDCGACAEISLDLALSGRRPEAAPPGPAPSPDAGPRDWSRRPIEASPAEAEVPAPSPEVGGGRLRYQLTFSVTGRSRFLGHLETLEIIRRAVRRAGGRLAVSAGMRPKPLLALALPRAVGVLSRGELGEFTLSETPPPDFAVRLAAALPEGFGVLGLQPIAPGPALAARVVAADYEVAARAAEGQELPGPEVFGEASAGYIRAGTLLVERRRPDKRQTIDVKRYVPAVSVARGEDEVRLHFRAAVTPQGSARPEEVALVMGKLAGVELVPVRTERRQIVLSSPGLGRRAVGARSA